MARSGKNQGRNGPDEIYMVEIFRHSRTGVAVCERWKKDGLVHRVDGPAMITRDAETGAIIEEFWMRNNKPHRDNGPATLSRDPVTGHIKHSSWFINGQKVPAPRRSKSTGESHAKELHSPKGPSG